MSLEISKEKLGDDHPDVATSYNNIGSVYKNQGKYDDALKYYYMSLEILKKKLGDDHPNTKGTLRNIEIIKSKMES